MLWMVMKVKKIISICLFFAMAVSIIGALQTGAQNQDFMPGKVSVGLNEPYLDTLPEALFPELEIEKIEDFYGQMYELFKNIPNANEDALDRIRRRIGTVFHITLLDKSDEAVLNAIEILEQNPNVKYAEPDYIVGFDPPAPLNLHTASQWSHNAITEAYNKGFLPLELQDNYQDVITRAEFCRMAVRWAEYALGKKIDAVLAEKGLTRDPNAFTDTSDPHILAAYALGITSGRGGGLFDPNGQFSREQAATMIMNTCKAIGANTENPEPFGFGDIGTAAAWAVNGINFVGTNGIMSGIGGGNFGPTGMYTREQSIAAFNNVKA